MKSESNPHHPRLQLTVLTTTGLTTGFTRSIGSELIVIFHALLAGAVLSSALLTSTLLSLLSTSVLTALAASSRCLLAKVLAFAGSSHVSLEIVVLHSVICHVSIPPICSMV
jgi:hypothetical protein